MKKLLFGLLILPVICYAQKKELVVGQNAHYEVKFETSMGNFEVSLYNETPIHRDNFVKLASSNFYDNVLFHRVIKNFMIQAGDPKSKEASAIGTYGDNDSGYELPAEIVAKFFHKKGSLAAARTPDESNPERKSSGSQFYIVVGKVFNDSTMNAMKEMVARNGRPEITPEREAIYKSEGGTPHLDGAYTIFGELIAGERVVDKISVVKTSGRDRPVEDVFIEKTTVKIVEDK